MTHGDLRERRSPAAGSGRPLNDRLWLNVPPGVRTKPTRAAEDDMRRLELWALRGSSRKRTRYSRLGPSTQPDVRSSRGRKRCTAPSAVAHATFSASWKSVGEVFAAQPTVYSSCQCLKSTAETPEVLCKRSQGVQLGSPKLNAVGPLKAAVKKLGDRVMRKWLFTLSPSPMPTDAGLLSRSERRLVRPPRVVVMRLPRRGTGRVLI